MPEANAPANPASPLCGSAAERWGRFELVLEGPSEGNPFVEVELSAAFRHGNREVFAEGFYDGGGVYRVRVMPDETGEWRYQTRSNAAGLDGLRGSFTCLPPEPGNRGPVRVAGRYRFAYADGTRFVPFGTTCYAWVHQEEALQEKTLATLARSPFNKLRMCVLPKHYRYCTREPDRLPFERGPSGKADLGRFDPAFWRHLEARIAGLMDLGVEADLILFHPYDRWGFAGMDAETDDRYLRYAVARLAAFRNVWWSMANEYDFMERKTPADWDRFFRIVQEKDPAGHLRSIHNGHVFYDHGKPWVTHASVQSSEVARTREWRGLYRKPVLVDELCYEGNIESQWGNISARETVHRFWIVCLSGGYASHGETYRHPEDVLWWSRGGELHGESPPRIAFLRGILEDAPLEGLEPVAREGFWAGKPDEFLLGYFGVHQPDSCEIALPGDRRFGVEVIDTWGMTVASLPGTFSGECRFDLPGRPYMAVRISRVD